MLTLRTHSTPSGVLAVARWRTPNGRIVEQCATVRYDELAGLRPAEVGRFGGRLSRLVKKAARIRALRAIAKTAVQVARLTPYGAAASSALSVAKGAVRHARRIRDAGADEVRELATPAPSPRLPARSEPDPALWLTPRAQLALARMLARSA